VARSRLRPTARISRVARFVGAVPRTRVELRFPFRRLQPTNQFIASRKINGLRRQSAATIVSEGSLRPTKFQAMSFRSRSLGPRLLHYWQLGTETWAESMQGVEVGSMNVESNTAITDQ